MNEFIIWLKNEKRFLTNNDYDMYIREDKNSIANIGIFNTLIEGNWNLDEENTTIHQYIGNDDTSEQNKIYADCSIVEFDFKSISSDSLQGIFKYSNNNLCYEIELLNVDKEISFTYNSDLIKNLKVIGTIQEYLEIKEIK